MIMTWANAALLSAAILAVVNILDSHLVTRRFPTLRTFLLPVGMIHLTYGFVGSFVFGLPAEADASVVVVAVVSSCVRTAAIIILLDSLRHREVSRVIPIVYMYPMFVAVLAFLFLGERLAPVQWLAVVVVACGAVMVSSYGRQPSVESMERPRSLLLFLSAVLFAIADVTGKYALSQLEFWQLFWIGAGVMGATFVAGSLRKPVIAAIRGATRYRRALALMAMNEVIAPVGIVISYWALERGPVSLVSAVLSSRPLFVLIFALILSRRAPEFLLWGAGRKLFVARLVATVMVVGGLTVIQSY
jgi:uncharacterized membrane protein